MRQEATLGLLGCVLMLAGCVGEGHDRDLPPDSSGGHAGDGDDPGADDTDEEKYDVADGSGGGPGDEEDEECEQDVDIVFVMDVSTSMGGYLSKLADEIVAVDTAIGALGVPGERSYGLVVFVDDTMVLNEGAPYEDVHELQADFREWSSFTQSNEQVGGGNWNGTWPENSLDALCLGASAFEWRPKDDVLRAIIHATDDTFWDGPIVGNGVPVEHGYDETVAILRGQEVRVFTFAAHIGGPNYDEDVTPGWYGPYQGKDSIPDATGGGVFDIDLVLAGEISLSDGIVGAIEENLCEEYPPEG